MQHPLLPEYGIYLVRVCAELDGLESGVESVGLRVRGVGFKVVWNHRLAEVGDVWASFLVLCFVILGLELPFSVFRFQ